MVYVHLEIGVDAAVVDTFKNEIDVVGSRSFEVVYTLGNDVDAANAAVQVLKP